MPKIKFRCISEGDGGTFPIFPPLPKEPKAGEPKQAQLPNLIGTYSLMTCVGVYFQVDKSRCFFAHIYSMTTELYPQMVVSKSRGEQIMSQVKHRLHAFYRHDNWDIRTSEFGNHLTLQCPTVQDTMISGKMYQTVGGYTVRAIREFFLGCSRFLEKETGSRSAFLRQIANDTAVNDKCHILIINPESPVSPIRRGAVHDAQGGSRNIDDKVAKKDLTNYEPVEVGFRKSICHFGVTEDDPNYLPQDQILSEDSSHRIETKGILWWAWNAYKNFGGKPTGEGRKLLDIFDQTHLS